MKKPTYLLAFLTYMFIIAECSTKFPITYFYFGIFQLFCFIKFVDTGDWSSWFDYAKRYSVIFPTMYLNFINAYPRSRLIKFKYVLNGILLLNVAEAGLVEFLKKDKRRKINGILLFITAFCTPFVLVKGDVSNSFGFTENTLWQVNNLLTLANCYLFSGSIQNSRFPLLYSIALPVISSVYHRDGTYWTVHRVQSIFTLLLIDSIFPSVYDNFHIDTKKIKNKIGFLEIPLLTISTVTTILLVRNKVVTSYKF